MMRAVHEQSKILAPSVSIWSCISYLRRSGLGACVLAKPKESPLSSFEVSRLTHSG